MTDKKDKLRKEIETRLVESGKDVTVNTINTYYYRILWIFKMTEYKTIDDILNNVEAVCEMIDDAYEEEKIRLSTATLTYLILVGLDCGKHKLFSQKAKEYAQTNDEERGETAEVEGLPTWKELEDCYYKLPENVFEEAQAKLVLGLYVLPKDTLRLDFADVKVFNDTSDVTKRDDNNWLLKKGNTYTFYLNNYKTVKQYGKQIIHLNNPELVRLLNLWFNRFNKEQGYLLVNKRKKPMSRSTLSSLLGRVTEAYLGIKVNNQLLRRIKESENIKGEGYSNLSLNEKRFLHRRCLHSLETAHEYVVLKKDQLTELSK